MIEPGDRQWWPFDVEVRLTRQSIEMSAKLMFLTSALRPGVRPFVQNSDLECGAIAENGRECLIAWRGKQRAEVLLSENEELKLKRHFVAKDEGMAFREASLVALLWLNDGVIAEGGVTETLL